MYTRQSRAGRFAELSAQCRDTAADAEYERIQALIDGQQLAELEAALPSSMASIHNARVSDLSTSNAIYLLIKELV